MDQKISRKYIENNKPDEIRAKVYNIRPIYKPIKSRGMTTSISNILDNIVEHYPFILDEQA